MTPSKLPLLCQKVPAPFLPAPIQEIFQQNQENPEQMFLT